MQADQADSLSSREWMVVGGIAVMGLVLRIAMGQGALWLDEAWSAMHAHEAGTPLGVFLGINHDNNHHLNSLWMQAVGIDAPPLLQRALAIVASSSTIIVAAILCRRQGTENALVAALLFAISPFFAHYGSEARGYAPMMLSLMVVLLRTDQWLAGGSRPTVSLMLWTVLGLLSQLTMVMGLFAIAGLAFLTLARHSTVPSAAAATFRTFAPAAVAGAVVVGGILLAARINSGGMRFGSLEPFTYHHELKSLFSIAGYTIGVADLRAWPVIALLMIFGLAVRLRMPRVPFYWLALIAFPAAVALLHPANPGHARYYSLVAIAFVLMLADVGGAALRAAGWRRISACAALGAILLASLVEDARLIVNQRGDPGLAIAALKQRSPSGSVVLVERPSAVPVLVAAGAVLHYPLRITDQQCPSAPFLFIDRYNGEALPGPQSLCGRDYVPIATMRATGMTNFHWRLYQRR